MLHATAVIFVVTSVDPRCAPSYNLNMIKSFKHKGLKLFFEKSDYSGIQAKHRNKLRLQLAALDTAESIDDMDLPGYRLHKLQGQRDNCWSIRIATEITSRFCIKSEHHLDAFGAFKKLNVLQYIYAF